MKKLISLRVIFLSFFLVIFLNACANIPEDQEKTTTDSSLISFARCIKASGAKFYGASWCSHCNAQKQDFGSAAGELPYIECALSGGQGQAQECVIAGVRAYPTWKFADGSSQSGRLTFAVLAEKTGCTAP